MTKIIHEIYFIHQRYYRVIRDFLHNDSGNFGIMTAILMVPIAGVCGAVMDLAIAAETRSQLMFAADAAALSIVRENGPAHKTAEAMSKDGPIETGNSQAIAVFRANIGNHPFTDTDSVTAQASKIGSSITSSVSFRADVPTTIMRLFNYDKVTVSGTATARSGLGMPIYADYHLLLDNTPSMGLGATRNDIDALIAATPTKCAFACHIVSSTGYEDPGSFYQVARRLGIRLRIDALREAAVATVDYARTISPSGDRTRLAAYSFGKTALASGHQIEKLSSLTSDLLTLRKSVESLSLMSTPTATLNEDGLTSFDSSLTQLGKQITVNGGEGKQANDRQQIVILITDGVGNSIKPVGCTGLFSGQKSRCIEPIDLDYCDALKKRNIKIAILQTSYVSVDDHLYNEYVKKIIGKVGPNLKACASDGLYAEVTIDGNMKEALKKLFRTASQATKVRLTQ